MSRRTLIGIGGAVGLVIAAVLAFGVFGVQTLFIDDEVSEDIPVFTTETASDLPSDEMTQDKVDDMNEAMVKDETPAVLEADEPMPDEIETPEIVELVEGEFIARSHPAVGRAVVLTDGSTQRFLRFEEDFETDNGPDLNVYLAAGVSADGDAGLFDDDFIDLGDLKGNIGSQNYELPSEVDLDVYNTVIVWCVRFGVAFGAADLAAV